MNFNGSTATIAGPKGSLTREFKSDISLEVIDNAVVLTDAANTNFSKALIGTYASHIKNMIQGVAEGFTKKLILEGVGYKVAVNGSDIDLALGFSRPVKVKVPEALTVTAEKNVITVTGINKEDVGQFAAKLRSLKKPEPYKGKGMRYEGEIIRRKEGKRNA